LLTPDSPSRTQSKPVAPSQSQSHRVKASRTQSKPVAPSQTTWPNLNQIGKIANLFFKLFIINKLHRFQQDKAGAVAETCVKIANYY
jgi:hypothetical protein